MPFPGDRRRLCHHRRFRHRGDRRTGRTTERLPERLRLKGREQESLLAVAAIRHIEDTVQRHRLPPPGLEELARDCLRLREIYTTAYDWPAPELPPGERTATRTMRQYIKAWITQWDMLRLGDGGGAIVEETMRSNYEEDEGLAASHLGPDDEFGVARPSSAHVSLRKPEFGTSGPAMIRSRG